MGRQFGGRSTCMHFYIGVNMSTSSESNGKLLSGLIVENITNRHQGLALAIMSYTVYGICSKAFLTVEIQVGKRPRIFNFI